MELIASDTSLVVAGSWNAVIFTPAWVREYGLSRPKDEPFKVQAQVPAVPGPTFQAPRYTLDEFSYLVRPDILMLQPKGTEKEELEIVENTVSCILKELLHTPVSGIGHNFTFQDAKPDPDLLKVFTVASQDLTDQAPDGCSASGYAITSTFTRNVGNMQINITREFDGSSLWVRFNFHYPVSSASQAVEVLSGAHLESRMAASLSIAKTWIESIYRKETV